MFMMTMMAAAAASAAPADPMSSKAMLPLILRELELTLPDAGSIKDMHLCPPKNIGMKNGVATSWTVLLSFNARGAEGGYVGQRGYIANFRNGRVKIVTTDLNLQGTFGLRDNLLDDALRKDLVRKLVACPAVSADDLTEARGSGGAA